MRARSPLGVLPALVLGLAVPAAARAQGAPTPAAPPPGLVLTMTDAVNLALARNQSLLASRLNVDAARADETTASLKPNPVFSAGADGFTLFSPSQMNWSFLNNDVAYSAGLDYLFERGGKRQKRIVVAQDTTDVTAKTVRDSERQVRFSTEQAFINVLLAKSVLTFVQGDLKDYSQVVEVNRQRVAAGDLAQGDFLKIQLDQLQVELAVSQAELDLVSAKAALRQLVGYQTVPDDFDVAGDLTYTPYTTSLADLQQAAVASRPDLLAAQSGVTLAQDQVTLELGNRARDLDGNASYTRTGPDSNTFAFGMAIDLPFHDRNQGNIAHSRVAAEQAQDTLDAARFGVMTDVVTAYAQYQTNAKIVSLYQSGYLDQAKQSLDISTYVFQRGAGSLLDMLDAERTYRDTELAFRQALAAYLTSVQQVNFVVGKQVLQ